MLVFFCVGFLTACSDIEDVAFENVDIAYKTFETIHDEELNQDITTEVIIPKTITLSELNTSYYKYTFIKLKINDTSEMESCAGFDICFTTLSNEEVSFTFEIANGKNVIYSQEITLNEENNNSYEFYNDELKIALYSGDNIFFNFINLDEKIKVYDIIILGKDSEIDDEELYDDEDLLPDEEEDELNP